MTVALVSLILAAGCTTDSSGSGALPGDRLTRFEGSPVHLTDLVGRPAAVNLWAETCVPCRTEMPALEEAHVALGDRAAIVGLDTQDVTDRARSFAASIPVTYDLWSDPDGKLQEALGIMNLPTTIFIAADGRIDETHTGALTYREIMQRLTALIDAGTSVSAG